MKHIKRLFAAAALAAVGLAVLSAFGPTRVGFADEGRLVTVGGELVGISVYTRGLIVVGACDVETADGYASGIEGSDLQKGDVLLAVDGRAVDTAEEVGTAIAGLADTEIALTLSRDGRTVETTATPRVSRDGTVRLGLWLKNHTGGIGTLTCVDGARFFALGHAVTEEETGIAFPVRTGALYPCDVVGIRRGAVGEPGSVRGAFSYRAEPLGVVEACDDYGMYGTRIGETDGPAVGVAPHSAVKKGAAKLYSAIGGTMRAYDVEILRAAKQKEPCVKSLVLRVTDPDLLALTGGIVQGMSGSPIVQNGKLVGAVTHVLTQDPTKGFGVYFDWMERSAAQTAVTRRSLPA